MLHTSIDPLRVQSRIIEENDRPPTLDFTTPLSQGVKAGSAVVNKIEDIDNIKKARAFEELLASGEEGMQAVLKDLQDSGIDITTFPNPKLYLNSKEDIANFYTIVGTKSDAQKSAATRATNVENLSSPDPEAQIAGIKGFVSEGDAKPLAASKAITGIRDEAKFQKLINEGKVVEATTKDIPSDAIAFEGKAFSPLRTSFNDDVTKKNETGPALGRALALVPDEYKPIINEVAKDFDVPADILATLPAIESENFTLKPNPASTAKGLFHFIDETGQALLKRAKEQGKIDKDVDYTAAIADPKMNFILGALSFKENYAAAKGNLRETLLRHRLSPSDTKKFLAGERVIITPIDPITKKALPDEDITDSVDKWIKDAMSIGLGNLPQRDAGGVRDIGMGNEIDQLKGSIAKANENLQNIGERFGSVSDNPRAKENIAIIESVRDSKQKQLKELLKQEVALQKRNDALEKEKRKGQAKRKEAAKKVTRSLDTIISLAELAGPDGLYAGFIVNRLNDISGGAAFANTAAFLSFRRGLAANIAKGIGGEGTRLTEGDIARALEMIPTNTESIAVFNLKLAYLKNVNRIIKDESLNDEEKSEALITAIYREGIKIDPGAFNVTSLLKDYKKLPSDTKESTLSRKDDIIRKMLLVDGQEVTDENIAFARTRIEQELDPTKSANPAKGDKKNVSPSQNNTATSLQKGPQATERFLPLDTSLVPRVLPDTSQIPRSTPLGN